MSAPETLTERVKGLALAVGFDLVGVAPAEPGPETERLRPWLAHGYAGEMHYLARRVEERVDPRKVLDAARSIIALGFVYDPGAFTRDVSTSGGAAGSLARRASRPRPSPRRRLFGLFFAPFALLTSLGAEGGFPGLFISGSGIRGRGPDRRWRRGS